MIIEYLKRLEVKIDNMHLELKYTREELDLCRDELNACRSELEVCKNDLTYELKESENKLDHSIRQCSCRY